MKRIQLNYKPLDKSVSLRIVSGSTMQQYNATTGEYVPDHTLVPLVIQPDVYISDPDGVITAGLKNAQLTDVTWYENSISDGNSLTGKSSYAIDTSASATRGRLTVKKNIPEGEQLLLIFTAKFLDTRTGYGIPLTGSIQLGVSQAVEEAIPVLVSSYPVGARLYPTTGQQGLKISCKLVAGGTELSPTFKWEGYASGAWGTLSTADGYEGTTAGTLWIPKAQLSRQSRFRCTATYRGKAYTAEHTVGIAYENYWAEIIVPGDGEVSPESASVQVRAEVKNNAGTIQNPSRYFLIEWFDQNGTKLGTGETLTIQKNKYASSDFLIDLKVSEIYGDTSSTPGPDPEPGPEPEGGYWVLNDANVVLKAEPSGSSLVGVALLGGCTFKSYGSLASFYAICVTSISYFYGIYGNYAYFYKKIEGVWRGSTTQFDLGLIKETLNELSFTGFSDNNPKLSVNGTEVELAEMAEGNPPAFSDIEAGTMCLSGSNLFEMKAFYTLTFENYNLTMKNADGDPVGITFVPEGGESPQEFIEHITE